MFRNCVTYLVFEGRSTAGRNDCVSVLLQFHLAEEKKRTTPCDKQSPGAGFSAVTCGQCLLLSEPWPEGRTNCACSLHSQDAAEVGPRGHDVARSPADPSALFKP